MRKSIDVEAVTTTLVNAQRAKLWRNKVEDLIKSVVVASTEYKSGYQQQLKEELEFAKANIELLSEEDYKWLLEQEKSPTIESKKSKKSLSIDSPEFKKALAEAPFVCKTHCESEEEDNLPDSPENHPAYIPSSKHTEIMDEFNKLPPYDSLASSTVKGAINKSDQPIVAIDSPKLLWVVQVTNGKDSWYKSTKSFKDNCVTSSINDANLYYTKADAEFYAKFMKAHNKGTSKWPSPVKVTVKEVVYTENASRTVELVKPVDSTVKKVRKPKKVYLIQDKKTKQYVTYVDHHNLELTKYISEARLYTSMGTADSDCKYLSRYKDTNCKAQLEVVEMPDDEKFVLWSNGSLEFFVRIDSTGIRTTKNIDEATRYVSYKSASTAVKRTDKELPYRFSISTVKNVKPLVVPVEKPVKKVKEPKVKEEWVLYTKDSTGTPYYYHGEISIPTYQSSMKLEMAVKFPSYARAVNARFELVKAGFIALDVANVEDCK